MTMKQGRIIFNALVAAIASGLFLCGCNHNGMEEDIPTIVDEIEYDTDLTFEGDVFIAPGISSYFAEPLQRRAVKTASSVESAKVVICPTSFITANADLLAEYVSHNGIIIEIEPETAGHNAWFGMHGFGKIDEFMNISAYGVFKNNTYIMDDIFAGSIPPADGYVIDPKEAASSSAGSDNASNYDAKPVEVGKTAEYCDTKLNSLVNWANTYTRTPVEASPYDNDPAVPKQIKELSDLISDSAFTEHITYSVNVDIEDYQICKVALSDPDKITRHSSVDVDLYITPFYAYQDPEVNPAGRGGDYYFVRQKVTSHNQPMMGSYRKKHGAVVTQANAFWLEDMHTTAFMCTMKDMELFLNTIQIPVAIDPGAISFEQTPSPESTAGSGSFTEGFSAALNVNGQVGVVGGKGTGTITVGGTFTWTSSKTRTISDYAVEMSTESGTRAVEYHFRTMNTIEDDDYLKAVPAIGRTDRSDEASWCWHVNNTADGDTTTCFHMVFQVDPIYGFMYRHSTWAVEGHTKTCSADNSNVKIIRLPIPDRTLSGVIELTSTNSRILSDVRFVNNESGEVAASFNSVYKTFDSVSRQVPVGNYSVYYSVYDGDDSSLIGNCVIPSVDVYTARTTQVSTLEGDWL